MSNPAAVRAIREALSILMEPGHVHELRVLDTVQGTVSGYFNDADKMAACAATWSGKAPAVFLTLNPVTKDLLARANNRAKTRAKRTTTDDQVVRRRWLLIDCDPRRLADIPSTDTEHNAALDLVRQIKVFLIGQGIPPASIVLADSGNGAHVLVRIDLPNDAETRTLQERCLKALDLHFSNDAVAVDLTTFNASRLVKLYGTRVCKGDATADRPHRTACILEAPDEMTPAPRSSLEAVAAMVPQEPAPDRPDRKDRRTPSAPFDLETWIADHSLPITRSGPWSDGGRKWVLSECLWNPEHTDSSAYIVQRRDGPIGAGCHHNSCAGKSWHDLRDVVEPGWNMRRDASHVRDEPQAPPTCDPNRDSQVGRGALPLVRLADLRAKYSGKVEWVVEGYFARGELGFLAGAGESLKSWAATHLAAAIDAKFKWLGVFEVHAERVLFIEQERAGNLVYQLNRIEVAERVTLGSDRLCILPPMALPLSEAETQQALEAAIIEFRPDVVIINALRDVLGRANENSPTDMAALLHPLGRMAEAYGCCILIVDHFNKAGLSGVTRGNAAHAGTAQKHAEADFVLVAERPRNELGKGTGPATVSITKRRSGDPGAAFSVTVRDTPDGGVTVRAKLGVRTLSPNAQAIRQMLEDGPAQVDVLATRLGKTKDTIRQGLSELKAAHIVRGKGEPGKPFTYELCEDVSEDTDGQPYLSQGMPEEAEREEVTESW